MTRASLVSCAILLVPLAAAAQPDPARAGALGYTLGPGVTRCPDAAALRETIAARLGRDPFAATSPERTGRLAITVLRVGRGLRALITWDRGDGTPPSAREVASPTGDCTAVVATAALAISLALDVPRALPPGAARVPDVVAVPAVTVPAAVVPTAITPVAVSPAAGAPFPEARPAPPPTLPSRWWVFLAPAFGVGLSPGGDLGAVVDVGVSAAHVAVSLGFRADLPVTTGQQSSGGSARTQNFSGGLALCWHSPYLGDSVHVHACALGEGGVLLGEGLGVDSPRRGTAWVAAVGARGMADFRLSRRLGLRLRLDAVVPLRRSVVSLDREALWEESWLRGSVALGLVVHFG